MKVNCTFTTASFFVAKILKVVAETSHHNRNVADRKLQLHKSVKLTFVMKDNGYSCKIAQYIDGIATESYTESSSKAGP